MNFKKRFQGRMLVIKKQGIDELISSGGIPVKDSSPIFPPKTNNNPETNNSSKNFTDYWNSLKHINQNSYSHNFATLNLRDPNSMRTNQSPSRRSVGASIILQNDTSFQAKPKTNVEFHSARYGEERSASLKPRSHNGSLFLYPHNDLSNSFEYMRNLEATINQTGRVPLVSRNSILKRDPSPIRANIRNSRDSSDYLDLIRNDKNFSPINQGIYSNISKNRERYQEARNVITLKSTNIINHENPRISFSRVPRSINEYALNSNKNGNESFLLMKHANNSYLREPQKNSLKDLQTQSNKVTHLSFNEIKSPSFIPPSLVRQHVESKGSSLINKEISNAKKSYKIRAGSAQYPSLTHFKEDY